MLEGVAVLALYVGVHVYADVDGDASQCAGMVAALHLMYDPAMPETCCLTPDATCLPGLQSASLHYNPLISH